MVKHQSLTLFRIAGWGLWWTRDLHSKRTRGRSGWCHIGRSSEKLVATHGLQTHQLSRKSLQLPGLDQRSHEEDALKIPLEKVS